MGSLPERAKSLISTQMYVTPSGREENATPRFIGVSFAPSSAPMNPGDFKISSISALLVLFTGLGWALVWCYAVKICDRPIPSLANDRISVLGVALPLPIFSHLRFHLVPINYGLDE